MSVRGTYVFILYRVMSHDTISCCSATALISVSSAEGDLIEHSIMISITVWDSHSCHHTIRHDLTNTLHRITSYHMLALCPLYHPPRCLTQHCFTGPTYDQTERPGLEARCFREASHGLHQCYGHCGARAEGESRLL